jgi:two-component system, OmpR family, KDP operon response regulator KdpE
MRQTSLRLLLAEDEPAVAELISLLARMHWIGCKVSVATTEEETLALFKDEEPHLVVLGLAGCPDARFDLCVHLRSVSDVPIMVLVPSGAPLEVVRALDLGADDCMGIPFDSAEFLARLRRLLWRSATMVGSAVPVATAGYQMYSVDSRMQGNGAGDGAGRGVSTVAGNGHRRNHDGGVDSIIRQVPAPEARNGDGQTASDYLEVDGLRLDRKRREVWLDGTLISFTSTEYKLLEELINHAGQVLSHRQLLERVWGPEYSGEFHYLKVFVARLRQKLGDNTEHPRFIQTDWGNGYRFVPTR